MLKIRLQRTGRRNLAHYRLVVTEKTAPVKGRFIERVGWYNPHSKAIGLRQDRILSWLNNGAKPSSSVAKLLTRENITHRLIQVKVKSPKADKTENKQTATVSQAAETVPKGGDVAD